MRLWTVVFLVLSIIGHNAHCQVRGEEESEGEHKDYLNHWVVEIEGGSEIVKQIAALSGFQIDKKFKSIPDHYLLKHTDVPHRSKRSAEHHTARLSSDPRVKFVEQQHEKIRKKRGFIQLDSRALAGSIARSSGNLNDPAYTNQWYINEGDEPLNNDMGVKEAWRKGVTGKGVTVTILDDGIERTHPDLAPNYEPKASYDFNDDDDDPSPRYEETNENKHGTRCGGEVAMVANNKVCGVGIAFNAGIGGVRMLDGKVTDHTEGEAIGFGQNVDISSASWGPNDDGKTMEMPGRVAMKGIMQSINKGRDGKGTILVWAAGNGALSGDNCNCDGYTSSVYTLSISSASEHGKSPWYSERCSSTMAATYSSGSHGERKVVSADLHGKCTNQHTGTSAAAPMAAGILALVLEMNPDLTWREVQHLVAMTSKLEPLIEEQGWYRNGVGLCVNHAFGFGLMDAAALVDAANPRFWKKIGEQRICRVEAPKGVFPEELTAGNAIEVEIQTDGCKGQEQEVRYLEQIQIILSLDYSKRGNIYVEIESPSGTITPLMFPRGLDSSSHGFQKWPLTSVHTWGENSSGVWKLRVADQTNDSSQGKLKDVELVLYGTQEKPFYHDNIDKQRCANLPQYPEKTLQQEPASSPLANIKSLFE